MQNKEKLKKLLDIFEELLKIKGNEWMVDDLLNRISKTVYTEKNLTVINEIYEYCVEEIISKQAMEFYQDFPLVEVREILIEDYKRMERFKRQDNFDDFCLALYQQIECITNSVIKDKILMEIAPKLMTYPAYVNDDDFRARNLESEYCVAKLLFLVKPEEKYLGQITNLYAIDKIRLVMYFICYKASLKNTDYKYFKEFGDLIFNLYQYRNRNHRGEVFTETQTEIFKKIEPIKAFYYLKFSTFLVFYIDGIKSGFPLNEDFVKYCKSLNERKYSNSPKVIGKIDVSAYSKRDRFR